LQICCSTVPSIFFMVCHEIVSYSEVLLAYKVFAHHVYDLSDWNAHHVILSMHFRTNFYSLGRVVISWAILIRAFNFLFFEIAFELNMNIQGSAIHHSIPNEYIPLIK
jgi:hypothetical protein